MIDQLLSKLNKVKQVRHNEWKACCPAHDDRNPSLKITLTDSGKILVKCWTGCTYDEIVQAVGMCKQDFNPDLTPSESGRKQFVSQKTLDQIEHEKRILQIAKNDREQGKRLSPRDLARERQAFEKVRAYEKSNR